MPVSWSKAVECTKEDSVKVVELLRKAKTERGAENRMMYFGKKFLGVPYVAHTLENGSKEHLIVNLHELDCTTFVETVLALAVCDKQDKRTFKDYCDNLTLIRYRQGKMTDYTSRLHYFTWWVKDNIQMGIIKEILSDGKGSPFTGLQTISINYMTSHPDSYKQLKNHKEFVPVIRKYENNSKGEQYKYIPKANIGWGPSTGLGVVESGDIVAMLTSKSGLDTTHIGIAVWQNGKLHLLNASSIYKKVVIDSRTFYDYMQRQTSQIGIRVFRF